MQGTAEVTMVESTNTPRPRAGAGTRNKQASPQPAQQAVVNARTQGRRPSRATGDQDSPPGSAVRRGDGAAAQLAGRRSFMWGPPISPRSPASARTTGGTRCGGVFPLHVWPSAPAGAAGTCLHYAPETRRSQPLLRDGSVTESCRQSSLVLESPARSSVVLARPARSWRENLQHGSPAGTVFSPCGLGPVVAVTRPGCILVGERTQSQSPLGTWEAANSATLRNASGAGPTSVGSTARGSGRLWRRSGRQIVVLDGVPVARYPSNVTRWAWRDLLLVL